MQTIPSPELLATPASAAEILPLRERYREGVVCQIIHDSVHRRAGWTKSYRLNLGDTAVGFGSVAIGGPWTGRPTVFEFYVLPEHQHHVFRLFTALLRVSEAQFIETQTNGTLLAHLLHMWSRDVRSEKILFADKFTTALSANGAVVRQITSAEETLRCMERREGGCECVLELDGTAVATGGILFHYNRPYGDIYMETAEPFRRRGFGSYLVQELKRICHELGATPAARCDPDNIASRQTIQKAGFVPCGHLLSGAITERG